MGWSHGYSAIIAFLKETGRLTKFSQDKIITLPNRENLKSSADNQILQAQKNAELSLISDLRYKIKSLQSDIKFRQKDIANLKERYRKTFGEECPNDSIDEG